MQPADFSNPLAVETSMPQGSDVHQKQLRNELRKRMDQEEFEHKLDMILDRLHSLEKRVADLTHLVKESSLGRDKS
jgi:hypothetical protein